MNPHAILPVVLEGYQSGLYRRMGRIPKPLTVTSSPRDSPFPFPSPSPPPLPSSPSLPLASLPPLPLHTSQSQYEKWRGEKVWEIRTASRQIFNRAVALTSQNHVTECFREAKEHGVQWQLNGNYFLTCTGRVAARSNQHGNCTTATVDTVVLRKFRAACISKITVEITTSCHTLL